MTIEQIQTAINNKTLDARQLVNLLADYIQSNPSSPGGGALQTATVTLTDAQIKALPTAPIEVIAAPGTDKAILVLGGFVTLNTIAGAYTADANSSLQLFYSSGIYIEITAPIKSASGLTTAALRTLYFTPRAEAATSGAFSGNIFNNLTIPDSNIRNNNISIGDVYVGVADYTGGNAANTLKVIVYYVVVDL